MARIPTALQGTHQHGVSGFCDFGWHRVAGRLRSALAAVRGGTLVYDNKHLALWERGKGLNAANMKDGTKVTGVFPQTVRCARDYGTLPLGGIARFYGTAKIERLGAGV